MDTKEIEFGKWIKDFDYPSVLKWVRDFNRKLNHIESVVNVLKKIEKIEKKSFKNHLRYTYGDGREFPIRIIRGILDLSLKKGGIDFIINVEHFPITPPNSKELPFPDEEFINSCSNEYNFILEVFLSTINYLKGFKNKDLFLDLLEDIVSVGKDLKKEEDELIEENNKNNKNNKIINHIDSWDLLDTGQKIARHKQSHNLNQFPWKDAKQSNLYPGIEPYQFILNRIDIEIFRREYPNWEVPSK